MAAPTPPNATDEDLERQAEEMAAKALPVSLPESVRVAKLPAVKQKILNRLKAQRTEQAGGAVALVAVGVCSNGTPISSSGGCSIPSPSVSSGGPPPPPPGLPPPPPLGVVMEEVLKIDGVELCGDEVWFADRDVRRRLRESVEEAHKEQKILVGQPADEVDRICPPDGRILGAGAVLRLGGAHLGGYGESDIAYAYRQLSRALHPDKNPHIPKAPAAFHRLSEAAEELRQGLNEQRVALQVVMSAMGGHATAEMLARPQEALFAEACRLLVAICGGVGEGEVPISAQGRAAAAYARSGVFHSCQLHALLSEWFDRSSHLEFYASPALRTAYDCAPKRFRAQFLCLLNRAVVAEAKRCNGCVRGGWSQIMQTFPELGIWREFRELLQQRVWDTSRDPGTDARKTSSRNRSRARRDRSRSGSDGNCRKRRREDSSVEGNDVRRRGNDVLQDPQARERDVKWDSRWKSSDDAAFGDARREQRGARETRRNRRRAMERHPQTGVQASRWARKWRAAMASVLPGAVSGASSPSDKEVRKLCARLWKEVVCWASGCDAKRGLSLFRADHQTPKTFGWDGKPDASTTQVSRGLEPGTPPADWAFIPAADLLFVIGEGVIGMTVEGMFVDNPVTHKRRSFSKCFKRGDEGKRTDGRKSDSKEDRRGEKIDDDYHEQKSSTKWDR